MPYLFTSESVSEGHPDKVADQISDALLDEFLKQDPQSKVACETLVTTGLVVLSGEVKTEAYVDVQKVARDVIKRIGYTKSEYKFDADACGVISAIHEQSSDINQGVERANPEDQGAGDQGMMFGYATNETDNYMPLALSISHLLLQELSAIRKEGKEMTYLRPDAKSQVTIRYSDNHVPEKIDTIVISTQHDEFEMATEDSAEARQQAEDKMVQKISEDVAKVLMPRVLNLLPERIQKLFNDDIVYHINPTGKFVIGGPHGDTGLTGRKIIVDTYGGKGAHGGGAFSGKDSSKVDRSAAYAARHIAKNLVAAGVADQALVQVAYAIGVAKPVGLYVTTYGSTKVQDANGNALSDGEIAEKVNKLFDLRPYAIVQRFGLQNPIFSETAAYGHMGRTPGVKTVAVGKNGQTEEKEFETFTWEKLDYVDKIKAEFGL
ncbi:methionine adenosyltransferase [Pontibacter harenae]|uniref:methionine adenosyltransferase n=1 Tax=Pontibacter harenae TaxID=2894083 RepID=UPI001E43C271|nr:methionine adenosyltransferase [Pontibacter harenae]MCC9168173.1 methionine adenosyltransferase [Pontibacter harenae]